MSLVIERGFISKLLQTKDLETVRSNQIKSIYFKEEHRSAYEFITDTVLDTGEVPTVRAFKRKFPHYVLEEVEINDKIIVGTEENLAYWCSEIRNKVKHNTLDEIIGQSADKMQGFNTEEAYKLIKKGIVLIENDIEVSSSLDITQNTEDRKQAYLDRKKNKGIIGIPTGFDNLDYKMKGIVSDTLTTIIARTGIGKTWIQIIIGANLMLANYRVLHLVTEMSNAIMQDRYEAVLFSKCYGSFNYEHFKSGKLDNKVEKKFFEFLENDLPGLEPLIIDTATSVIGVSALIDKYDPDIVIIDSAYLMEDDQGAKDDWLRVAHITRDLKKLAKRSHKPIMINTQADKNTSKKTGPGLESIMFTQAVGQDSDVVIALSQNEIQKEDREMCISLVKNREGDLCKVVNNWDFSCMDFSDIYAESKEDEEDEDEEVVENGVGKNTLNVLE